MRKFDTVFRGYDKTQVHNTLDEIIKAYEGLLSKSKITEEENKKLTEKNLYYEKIESTLNRAIFAAENASDQIRHSARGEAESLLNEAKKNANRIINDALLKAERVQNESDNLKRNMVIYKRRLKSIIESQLEIIEEMEKIDLRSIDRD